LLWLVKLRVEGEGDEPLTSGASEHFEELCDCTALCSRLCLVGLWRLMYVISGLAHVVLRAASSEEQTFEHLNCLSSSAGHAAAVQVLAALAHMLLLLLLLPLLRVLSFSSLQDCCYVRMCGPGLTQPAHHRRGDGAAGLCVCV
jgi:hypothetical protein